VADPSIAWRILLIAELDHRLDPVTAREALARLYAEQRWEGVGTVETDDDPGLLRARLGELRGPVVACGLAGSSLIVSAHHSAADGLGLLALLAALTGSPASSAARGVGQRADASGFVGAITRRLVEVVAVPPARVAAEGGDPSAAHDVYAQTTIGATPATADLVYASARGISAHNAAADRRTRHVAVAIGVARPDDGTGIADRSALLRLRNVERLDRDDIADLLRTAPTQHPVQDGSGGALLRLGLRVLGPRLGSTLLVSHLGAVSAPGARDLAFYPVTAGGTGLSLGASTLRNQTTITLRARGQSWSRDGLERLLETIARELR